jgi:hypothetical protein
LGKLTECLDIYDSFLLLAEKVKYSSKSPMLGAFDYWLKIHTGQVQYTYQSLYETIVKPHEITKKEEWSHEKEWRVLSFEKDSTELYSDYYVNPRTFSKVFLGHEISSEDRFDIKELLKFDLDHVELYDMKLDYKSGSITFNKVDS